MFLVQVAEPIRMSIQRQQKTRLQLSERLLGSRLHALPQSSAGPELSEDNGCVVLVHVLYHGGPGSSPPPIV